MTRGRGATLRVQVRREGSGAAAPDRYGRTAAVHQKDNKTTTRAGAVRPHAPSNVPAGSGNARLRSVSGVPDLTPPERRRGREPLRLHYAAKSKTKIKVKVEVKVKVKTVGETRNPPRPPQAPRVPGFPHTPFLPPPKDTVVPHRTRHREGARGYRCRDREHAGQVFRQKIECYPGQVMDTAPACG